MFTCSILPATLLINNHVAVHLLEALSINFSFENLLLLRQLYDNEDDILPFVVFDYSLTSYKNREVAKYDFSYVPTAEYIT